MASIEETLTLVDRFTPSFLNYISLSERAAGVTSAARLAAEQMGRADLSGLASGMRETSNAAQRTAPAINQAVQALEAARAASAGTISGLASQTGALKNQQSDLRSAMERAAGGSREADAALRQYQRDANSAADSTNNLTAKVKQLAGAYLSLRGIQSALKWAGENLKLSNVQRNAENQLRAVLMNMGAQEVAVPVTANLQVDTAQTMSAFDTITQKASEIQGRGIYGDEAMIAGAAELATYFKDTNAIMSMMDTLADYTMGMTGGGAVGKEQMVQYATDVGKIMSGSYIAMTKKGFEFTEAQKAIVEGTATEAQIVETLGKEYLGMSADMQAAAAINAVIAESWGGLYDVMSDTPEGKIIQLQNRLGDLRETLGDRIYPAVLQVVDVFNNNYGKIERILTAFSDGCARLIVVIGWLVNAAITAGDFIIQHGDLVTEVLLGIAVAAGVAKAGMVSSALASAAAWTAAHWPLVLIAASVAVVIQMALKMGYTWADVCGFIGSVLYELYSFGYNIVADAWNLLASFGEFFANFLDDPAAAIAHLLADLADWALGILQNIARGIDTVFGSHLANAVNGWRSKVQLWAYSFGAKEVTIDRMTKIDYGEAWERGNVLGRDFYNSLSNLGNLPESFDASGALSSMAGDGVEDKLGDIARDTGKISKEVSLSKEDIKSLVDMAERRYVNNINLTAQSPVIHVHGQNTGNSRQDRKALADTIRDILIEQSAAGSTRATARV